MVTAEDILRLLEARRYRPLRFSQLARLLEVPEEGWNALREIVRELQLQGLLVEAQKGRLFLPEHQDLVVGVLEATPDGACFVVPRRDDGHGDVYVSPEDCATGLHGDTVVARILKRGRRGPSRGQRRGAIVRVIQRARATLVGSFQQGKNCNYCIPDNPRIRQDILLPDANSAGAQPSDKVVVRLFEWTNRRTRLQGEVVEVLGPPGGSGVDALSIIRDLRLPDTFSPQALQEARSFGSTLPEGPYPDRLDLRSTTILTIDPQTAHDFDDAVSLERLPAGGWKLGVHIADVSHYVRPGTALDREAQARGTSVYLPGQVLPMLPGELSGHLCSLVEGEDRLAKSVFFEFGPRGAVSSYDVHRSVIRSARRLTYEQAEEMLEDRPETASNSIHRLLAEMEPLARTLHRRRMEQGALELDLPEIELVLDETGEVRRAKRRDRLVSHRIIEEFMLAANQAVAHYCRRHRLPCMFRIHEPPDEGDTGEFLDFILAWGYSILRKPDRFEFQKLLEKIKNRSESYPITLELLKSMRRAEYSAHHLPHYALAMDRYCHFTSPIRRYPDLLVHRILDEHLAGRLQTKEERDHWQKLFEEQAPHCTSTERRAGEAEQELSRMKLLRHLERRRGEPMPAIIVRVRHFGFFVELQELLIQGLVHRSRLTDDDFYFDDGRHCFRGQRSGKIYSLGDRIEVVTDRVDTYKRHVDFVIPSFSGRK